MKILFLGPECSTIINFLLKDGHVVIRKEAELTTNDLIGIDYIVCYGYRYIISKDVIVKFCFKAINLHISFLPWNRGADPNLWSFLEDTPKGISIHYLDEGLDTGEIIVQREIEYQAKDTLKSSYERLKSCMVQLFCEKWNEIKNGKIICYAQRQMKGSYHRSRDKEIYSNLLIDGWETRISHVSGKALEHRN